MSITDQLNYIPMGDYLVPDWELGLDHLPTTVGKYGSLRETHLKETDFPRFSHMLHDGTLWPHLVEVDETANAQVDQIMESMMKAQGVTEELKARDQLLWVQKVTNIKLQAEEIVMAELIYC